MTTIEEEAMDEFFNFEDAANTVDASGDIDLTDFHSGSYDVNLAFAQPEHDEDSFTCLQHFSGSEEQPNLDAQNSMMDTAMLSPADFTDFSRWIDGSGVPTEPCAYCRRMRIHCKIINEGLRKGSCTSCVALARSCSLTHDPAKELPYDPACEQNDLSRCPPKDFDLPGGAIEDIPDIDVAFLDTPLDILRQACDYCCSRGYQCKQIQDNGRTRACTSCVTHDRHCSFSNHNDLGDWKIDDGMNPNNAWIPAKSPLKSPDAFGSFAQSRSTPNLLSLRSSEENMNVEASESSPKIGARFSRESVRILRGWLSTHHRHPYPTDEEKEILQRQTGLNKTQVTNWLANARRRGKVRAPRSTSPAPHSSNYSKAIDIPRRSTPGLQNMNPLERWKNSPPESEAASVTAIAKAVTSSTWSSGRDSPYTGSYGRSDDGSAPSVCNVSSTSSLGTSQSSGGSFASAFSHKSRGSFGSFGSFGNRGRRRRRRQAPKSFKVPNTNGQGAPIRTYQCTFCTETFKTKHDWQRHEKSLHLSLERWICCPSGATQFCTDYGQNRCVFCGLSNPPDGHEEEHNYSNCVEKSLEERTFYRKDHLRQHLSLVHDVKFQGFSMESWKLVTPEIRSRCGFCGIVMGSWSFRVDHLAEHFKGGKSMADWKGDWGFEAQVLDIVENGIPPYLIHDERNSLDPFEASTSPPFKHRTVNDALKIGLVEYINDCVVNGGAPTDDELLVEARRIMRNLDEIRPVKDEIEVSWFRDLLIFSGNQNCASSPPPTRDTVPFAHKLGPANAYESHAGAGRDMLWCQDESALKAFVDTKQALGLTPTDSELQVEACRILDSAEESSNYKCRGALGWYKYLITASTKWLDEFRRRAGLPRSSEMEIEHIRSTDDTTIDYSIHNHRRLETELTDYVRLQKAIGITPTDLDLQNKARLIVFKTDDSWNQTVIDDPALLMLFKRQQGLAPENEDGPDMPPLSEATELGIAHQQSGSSPKNLHWDLEQTGIGFPSPNGPKSSDSKSLYNAADPSYLSQPLHTTTQNQPSANSNPVMPLRYFLNDANCYGRLVRELSRFVTTCMSANNPNRHVPTDAELQNQARWVIYDDDDPWNQTAADNAEWLIRFKRDVGLASATEGPGLPATNTSWQVGEGGTGFCPPYLNPKQPPCSFVEDVPVKMQDKVYKIKATTAQKFLKSMGNRYQPPAAIFCSRELEAGLNAYVRDEMTAGRRPSDEELKAKARELLGTDKTPAEDMHLLEKFKAMHDLGNISTSTPSSTAQIRDLSEEQMLAELDAELSQLQNMDFSEAISPTLDISGTSTPGMIQIDQERNQMNYPDTHRLHAATTLSLRRGASDKMAEQHGDPDLRS